MAFLITVLCTRHGLIVLHACRLTTQELTSLSRVNKGLNQTNDATDSNVQGEYFSSASNATLYDSANAGTGAQRQNQILRRARLCARGRSCAARLRQTKLPFTNLSPPYWKDASTLHQRRHGEKTGVTQYGTKNAGLKIWPDAAMFYFLERATLQSTCPQRDKIIDGLVKGWAMPSPKP